MRYVLSLTRAGQEEKVADLARDVVCITAKGRPVKAKTIGQRKYVESIQKNTVTIGVGPAGTGKTYLAVAAAVAAGMNGHIAKPIDVTALYRLLASHFK